MRENLIVFKNRTAKELDELAHTLIRVEELCALLTMALISVATFGVVIRAVKRKNWGSFPIRARIALIVYAIYAPCETFSFLISLIRECWDEELLTTRGRIGSAIAMTIWVSFHWQFTAYYLQTACLLRMTFSLKEHSDCKRVIKRKYNLQLLEYFGYIIIILAMSFLIFGAIYDLKDAWKFVWSIFYSLCSIVMMLITLFSVKHIHKYSKSIKKMGIKTNSTLMKLYVVLWIGLNLMTLI